MLLTVLDHLYQALFESLKNKETLRKAKFKCMIIDEEINSILDRDKNVEQIFAEIENLFQNRECHCHIFK